ncbi:AAA domain-containing protein [Luteolibacter flavescens]|uniref:AAA domain-containing protein n=1 Tax=Luteolibacter flavescens TaxID=1859460 RepID=A0ABT3FLH4_9BACT|nr:AAA domain-containing protein [Luteolibacter flavescens]MCW1884418.1 AAA domain-containing protein [Luteolibacter flavescens]
MTQAAEFLTDLESRIREEARHGWDQARERWGKPLAERVEGCRAIGLLEISEIDSAGGEWLVHFHPSEEDIAFFREEDRVRLSQNDPGGHDWVPAIFLGLTDKGLTVRASRRPSGTGGWTLDEDHVDLSEYYLKALGELARSAHGRDVVLPLLNGQIDDDFDLDAYDEEMEKLEDVDLDDSKKDAVARCLAASRLHLVQGPPGTGKTRALAETVRRLVEDGQRVLVSAFTHRAIHNALRKIRPLVDCPVFKVSDVMPQDSDGIDFRFDFADTGLVDHPGPYVVGITPISLFTTRASEARFDVAVIDETSQMRVEAAMMPMLRAERFFFFGDHCQLPPVVQRPVIDPTEDSVFVSLARSGASTMLDTTYRLNAPLAEWPSESFYQGKLKSAREIASHRFAMKNVGSALLDREPSLVSLGLDHEGNRSASSEEAEATAALIEEMLAGGVAPAEIGVVVPFRAQAAKVRKLLHFPRFSKVPGIRNLAVDTVERFQGQEREAMIVSFTVSDRDFMDRLADFLVFPQRLNVAVTRARTKVILIHSAAFREWLERRAEYDEKAALALSLLRAAGSCGGVLS